MSETERTYTDSRGAEMPFMSFSDALEIIHELAEGNQIDENDIAFGDAGLVDQRGWQQDALNTLGDFIANYHEDIDDLPFSNVARQWPDEVLQSEREMNPNDITNAIRICLDMAVQGMPDPKEAERNPELAEEMDRQYQAVDVVGDFVGMHREWLGNFVSVDVSSVFNS